MRCATRFEMRRAVLSILLACVPAAGYAATCTTQSQMQPAERDAVVRAGTAMVTLAAANNAEGVRLQTMPQYAQDFGGIATAISTAAPHLKGAGFVATSVWLLDAANEKAAADGSAQDAQFYCSLNKSTAQTTFAIPALPAGRYAVVVMDTTGTTEPWQVAMLLRQGAPGTWQLGGMFPRATTAGGHDGLWYWRAAREYATKQQRWNAFVYYVEAEHLLKPVSFLSSTHLETLASERGKAAPTALSNGVGANEPLVIAAAKGDEVRVIDLGAENAPGQPNSIDLVAHIRAAAPMVDANAAKARNAAAARAIVGAYPELRAAFHGVWIVAEAPTGSPYISEEPMTSLQ